MEKLGTYSVMEFRAVCKMSNIPATSTGHLGLIGCSLEPKQDSKTTWLGGMHVQHLREPHSNLLCAYPR
jgi:hypothetical protein